MTRSSEMTGTALHICAPPATSTQRRLLPCPVCRFRRRHVVQTFEWHDASVICGGCGYAWYGEECDAGTAEARSRRRAWVRCVWEAVRHPRTGIRSTASRSSGGE
jgi:hypothetical protein